MFVKAIVAAIHLAVFILFLPFLLFYLKRSILQFQLTFFEIDAQTVGKKGQRIRMDRRFLPTWFPSSDSCTPAAKTVGSSKTQATPKRNSVPLFWHAGEVLIEGPAKVSRAYNKIAPPRLWNFSAETKVWMVVEKGVQPGDFILNVFKDRSKPDSIIKSVNLADCEIGSFSPYRIGTAQAYSSRACIFLLRKSSRIPLSEIGNYSIHHSLTEDDLPFFFFFRDNAVKEAWLSPLTAANKEEESDESLSSDESQLTNRNASMQSVNGSEALDHLLSCILEMASKSGNLHQWCFDKIETAFEPLRKYGFSEIVVDELEFGQNGPGLENGRNARMTPDGVFSAVTDIRYRGSLQLKVSTSWTCPYFNHRALPVSLSLRLPYFNATVKYLMHPLPSRSVHFGFMAMPRFETPCCLRLAGCIKTPGISLWLAYRVRTLILQKFRVPKMHEVVLFEADRDAAPYQPAAQVSAPQMVRPTEPRTSPSRSERRERRTHSRNLSLSSNSSESSTTSSFALTSMKRKLRITRSFSPDSSDS